MRIYLTGPRPDINWSKFAEFERALRAEGHEVINAAKIAAGFPVTISRDEYMVEMITSLNTCETIFVLDGWLQSERCRTELEYACKNKLTVTFEGGRGCQNPSRQQQENSVRPQEQKSSEETTGNVFFARWVTKWKARRGLARK